MLDLKKNQIPLKKLVEDVLPAHMLMQAVISLEKDKDTLNRMDPMWGAMLRRAVLSPVAGVSKDRVRQVSHFVSEVASSAFRGAGRIDTYYELLLSTALLILHLVRDNRIVNIGCQGVLIAGMIVDEATEYGDVADLKVCRVAADKMKNAILEQGYFSSCH